MSESFKKEEIRRRVIGLGENSFQKSYYPQLQQRIDELEEQKALLEKTNQELTHTLNKLEETQLTLFSSEYKYRSLFEHANDAIFIIEGSEKRLIDCNTRALELFGYKVKKELLNQNIIHLFPEFQPNGLRFDEVALKISQNVLDGKKQVFEWTMINKKGNQINCVASLNSIDFSGKKYIQAIIRDVTEAMKMERALGMATIRGIEKERLRFAKELHDGIGPILSTIKLYVEWLKDDNTNPQKELILSKANESIVEATKSIKEIAYDLSPHVLENYGLESAINQVIENLLLSNKIEVSFFNNLKTRLHKDVEVLLYRVLSELLNNTIKHAQASKVTIQINKNNNALAFKYSDNGIGFVLDEIDDKKRGMGLYNIQNRIAKFGGVVNFYSQKGKGVNYEIYIQNLNYLNEEGAS